MTTTRAVGTRPRSRRSQVGSLRVLAWGSPWRNHEFAEFAVLRNHARKLHEAGLEENLRRCAPHRRLEMPPSPTHCTRSSRILHSDDPSRGTKVFSASYVKTVMLDVLLEVAAEEGVLQPSPYEACLGCDKVVVDGTEENGGFYNLTSWRRLPTTGEWMCSTCCTAAFAQHGTAAIVYGMDGVAVPLGAALLKSKLGWESEEEAAMAVAAEAAMAASMARTGPSAVLSPILGGERPQTPGGSGEGAAPRPGTSPRVLRSHKVKDA